MNVGKWIVAAYILFAGFIATLVTVCLRQDISLVSPDYYKKELNYQEQIERIHNTQLLEHKPRVIVAQKTVKVTFDSTHQVERGELQLFCPSNMRMDRTFSLRAEQKELSEDVSALATGMYRVKLYWSMDGKDYYHEEIVNL